MAKSDIGYFAVDCGKYNTKAAYVTDNAVERFKFRTKISPGTFDDDMFGKGSFIVQVDDGPVFKVGSEGKTEPVLETSKKSEVHRVCTMAAIGSMCGITGMQEVNIAIGIPLQLCENPEERIAYKDYILGKEGESHTVRIKTSPDEEVKEITFRFAKRYVYPEGIGVIYEYPSRLSGPTAIIDIGNLNINNSYVDRFNINAESCFTDELGGKILISELAETLTTELGSRVDENLVASLLLRPYESRELVPRSGDRAVADKSRQIIDRYLIDHVTKIKRKCDTRHWPLNFMDVVCVGGTSKLLARELKIVFGEDTFIPQDPEYTNVMGFLKRMCASLNIDLPQKEA